tara:strand:+ start:43 stop:654 length:612 start_codon:yes stop_codon:yes gene_type:complete
MNHIWIRFLISFLFFGLIYPSDSFQNWLKDNENKVFHTSGISKASFNIQLSTLDQRNNQKSDSRYILLDIDNNTFQIKIFDNIIYHDEFKTDQYNLLSNQLFRYNKDEIVSSLINRIISKDYFFNFSKYEYDKELDKYTFKFNNNSLNFILVDDKMNINYKDNMYSLDIIDLEINKLDKKQFNDFLLYNMIDTSSIEIFNFMN